MKLQRVTLFVALLACGLGACGGTRAAAPAAPPGAGRAVDTELALLTFDSAWSRIAHTHYDTLFNGVDWTAVRDELRPHAEAATTIGELRAVIDDMLARLGESHFGLIPREATDALAAGPDAARTITGEAGLEVRLVDGDVVVWRLRAGGAAADAGVRLGWTVVSVDGRPLSPGVEALAALADNERRVARTGLLYRMNALFAGGVGNTVDVVFRDEAGRAVSRQLALRPAAGEVVQFGNLPPVLASLEHELVRRGASCVGVIRLNSWMATLASAFDRAIDDMRGCAGVVIDLRGNPGGMAAMVMGTSGHFLEDTLVLGQMRSRTSTLRLKANPRRVRHDGSMVTPLAVPLAVLVDETSASTSEFFAAGLQAVGRARVFGSPSAGQALPALMVRLPTGDVLMHVIANFTGPGGSRIEGHGVIPDVAAPPTRQDLLAGRDAAFAAALDWITGSLTGNQNSGGLEP